MSASKAELWSQLSKAIKILDETFKYAGQNATNFLGLLDSLQQAYEGDHIGTTNAQFTSLRSQLNAICGTSAPLDALVIELARIGYNSLSTSASLALDDIAKGMNAASETITNRAWTYGSVAVGASNVGTGVVYRLTTDKYSKTIEQGAFPGGIVKIEIINDKNTGRSSGTEQAKIFGSGVIPTDYLYLGTAPAGESTLTAYRAEDGILSNANFSDYTDDAVNVTFTNWTLDNTTKTTYADVDTTTYYRKQSDGSAGVTMKFGDNNAATQYITNASSSIDPTLPCFLIVRYRRYSSCDGTLTIRLGSKTETVTLSSVSDATWYDLVLGVADSDGWYDNFKEDSSGLGARIKISLTSRTTGTLGIGEVILAQPSAYDGKYYLLTAGATDFLVGDLWTFTDSVANTGRIQTTIARLYSKHLPHTSGTPTYADA